ATVSGPARAPGPEGLDVGSDVDDGRAVRREGALERGCEVGGPFHADAEGADLLGDAAEVDHPVGPHLARLLRLPAAVGAVETRLGLIDAAVVVNHNHGVDAPAGRSLQIAHLVPAH